MIHLTPEEQEQYLRRRRDLLLAEVDIIEEMLHLKRTSEIRAEWKEVMGAEKAERNTRQGS